MGIKRYGLKKFEVSDIDETGAIVANTTVDLMQYVVKKSVEITEQDGSVTKHFAEGYSIPSIALKEAGEESAKLALFNFPLELLESLKGGTATTFDGKTKYVKSVVEELVEKHVKFTTKDDTEIIYKRSFIDTARDEKQNDSDVAKLNVMMIPLIPNDGTGEAVIIQDVGFVAS